MRHCATIREVPGSIPGRALGNFQVTSSFYPHSVALGSTQPLAEMSTKEFPWGKEGTARRDDNTAMLVVPNVNVKCGSQTFYPPSPLLSLHELLREALSSTFTIN